MKYSHVLKYPHFFLSTLVCVFGLFLAMFVLHYSEWLLFIRSFNWANVLNSINSTIEPVAVFLSRVVFFKIHVFEVDVPIIVLWLIGAAVYFTVYFNFVNVRLFKHAVSIINPFKKQPDEEGSGEVTHFQALAMAISGTVGIGNIGGVAVAVTIGGAGAIFWMVLAGFLGMSTKFIECTLSVKYRVKHSDGSVSGGPMYYLKQGLADIGLPKLGTYLGGFFAIGILIGALGIGNMFQANQAFMQLNVITNGLLDTWGVVFALIFSSVVFCVIIGGLNSIVKITERLVPFMALWYLSFGVIVIFMNIQHIPQAFVNIFIGAFTSEGIAGGAFGALIVGFQRALFSNEAGIGSAAIAHSAAKVKHPTEEGIVSLLEPFIDTIILSSVTALVIATAQIDAPGFEQGLTGIGMTSAAFENKISWFPYPLAIAGLLFAFSTMISWSYYGLKGWTYLFGKRYELVYKCIFGVFVFLGCLIQLDYVIQISDALVFLICIPNILGLLLLSKKVKESLSDYTRNYT